MNYLQRKKWAIMRAGSFHGYLRTASGYPLTLTDCMAEYPVLLSVSGNTVQDGTPAPDNPVEVRGVGDKTANLLNNTWGNLITNSDGSISTASNYYSSIIDVTDMTTIYISGKFSLLNSKTLRIGLCTEKPKSGGTAVRKSIVSNDTLAVADYNYIVLSFLPVSSQVTIDDIVKYFMVNEGETALPYEPYGYKVPLVISNSDGETCTFPIYTDTPLYGNGGVSDTVELDISNKKATLTQRYGVISFDGSESWTLQTGIENNVYTIKLDNAAYSNSSQKNSVTNLLPTSDRYAVESGTHGYHINTVDILSIYTDNSSLDSFKAWLAAQAAAGTPLTIIYRLKSAVTTDISNKIDWDSIPKFWRGTVVITADTTVSPSDITVKYYADKPGEEVN
ncbi:MAG: hypothetical protein ACI4RF_05915 [Eubacterium sp.]